MVMGGAAVRLKQCARDPSPAAPVQDDGIVWGRNRLGDGFAGTEARRDVRPILTDSTGRRRASACVLHKLCLV